MREVDQPRYPLSLCFSPQFANTNQQQPPLFHPPPPSSFMTVPHLRSRSQTTGEIRWRVLIDLVEGNHTCAGERLLERSTNYLFYTSRASSRKSLNPHSIRGPGSTRLHIRDYSLIVVCNQRDLYQSRIDKTDRVKSWICTNKTASSFKRDGHNPFSRTSARPLLPLDPALL